MAKSPLTLTWSVLQPVDDPILATVAHLYVSLETDSIYLDTTAEGGSPVTMAEPADGVYLHLDEAGAVVAVEVMDVSRRGGPDQGEMGHLHVNPVTDSLYLDVSAGDRPTARMVAVAEGVFLHVDETGALVGVEMTGLRKRGGLRVDDLDATPGGPRPAIFDEIERAARATDDAQAEA